MTDGATQLASLRLAGNPCFRDLVVAVAVHRHIHPAGPRLGLRLRGAEHQGQALRAALARECARLAPEAVGTAIAARMAITASSADELDEGVAASRHASRPRRKEWMGSGLTRHGLRVLSQLPGISRYRSRPAG